LLWQANFQEERGFFRLLIPIWEIGREEVSIPEEKEFTSCEPEILFAKREIEQYHMSISFPGIAMDNEDIYPCW
jgi:hypothetical protein